jgi:hypothetical protein
MNAINQQGFAQKVLEPCADFSRKAAKRCRVSTVFFAPLRGNLSLAKAISILFCAKPTSFAPANETVPLVPLHTHRSKKDYRFPPPLPPWPVETLLRQHSRFHCKIHKRVLIDLGQSCISLGLE